jgi:hypothetical protein
LHKTAQDYRSSGQTVRTLLRAWLAPLQAWLAGFADGPAFDHAPRLGLIDADPAEAGVAAASPAAYAHSWPTAASPAYRWGVHYVIEGSQLGGAVLYERLRGRCAPACIRKPRSKTRAPARVRHPIAFSNCTPGRDPHHRRRAEAA